MSLIKLANEVDKIHFKDEGDEIQNRKKTIFASDILTQDVLEGVRERQELDRAKNEFIGKAVGSFAGLGAGGLSGKVVGSVLGKRPVVQGYIRRKYGGFSSESPRELSSSLGTMAGSIAGVVPGFEIGGSIGKNRKIEDINSAELEKLEGISDYQAEQYRLLNKAIQERAMREEE